MTVFRDTTFLAAGPQVNAVVRLLTTILRKGRLCELLTRFSFLVALLFAVGFVGAGDKKAQDELQGKWKVTSMYGNGTEAKGKGATLVIKGDKISLVPDAKPGKERNFKITLDPTKSPKAIDALALDGGPEGQTILGIYQLKGDTLIWSMSTEAGGKRPTSLEPKQGDKAMILTAERVK